MRKKFFSLLILLAITFGTSLSIKDREHKTAKAYAALGYYCSKKGYDAETGLAVSLIGVWHSGLTGAAYGMAFGNVAGAAAGAAIGL